MQNPAEAMGSYGGVLMLGRGRTDNLSPSQDTCSHAAETASARFSTLELSLRAFVPSQGAQAAMRQAAISLCGKVRNFLGCRKGTFGACVSDLMSWQPLRHQIPQGGGLVAPCVCYRLGGAGRQRPARFRTIQVFPKDLRALPGHPEPAVSWQRVPEGTPCST
jgi:hypothetical protein